MCSLVPVLQIDETTHPAYEPGDNVAVLVLKRQLVSTTRPCSPNPVGDLRPDGQSSSVRIAGLHKHLTRRHREVIVQERYAEAIESAVACQNLP